MGLFDIFNTNDQTAAANAQIQGVNTGLGQLNQNYDAGRNALTTNYAAGLQPFRANFTNAQKGTNALGNALGLNGAQGNADALAAFKNNPGYQFQLQQGDNAILAAQAAGGGGGLESGNTLKALSDYNQGLAGTSWNNYVSQLQPYQGAATAAAGGIGTLYGGLGTALGANYTNQGNAAYGANTSIGNANANADLAGLTASGNLWGAGLGLLGAGTNLAGGGGLGAGLTKLFSPSGSTGSGGSARGYAEGGSPPVGKPSVVGERGPEVFVPSKPGVVIPSDLVAQLRKFADRGASREGTGQGDRFNDYAGKLFRMAA
jgi:hypothetical protein